MKIKSNKLHVRIKLKPVEAKTIAYTFEIDPVTPEKRDALRQTPFRSIHSVYNYYDQLNRRTAMSALCPGRVFIGKAGKADKIIVRGIIVSVDEKPGYFDMILKADLSDLEPMYDATLLYPILAQLAPFSKSDGNWTIWNVGDTSVFIDTDISVIQYRSVQPGGPSEFQNVAETASPASVSTSDVTVVAAEVSDALNRKGIKVESVEHADKSISFHVAHSVLNLAVENDDTIRVIDYGTAVRPAQTLSFPHTDVKGAVDSLEKINKAHIESLKSCGPSGVIKQIQRVLGEKGIIRCVDSSNLYVRFRCGYAATTVATLTVAYTGISVADSRDGMHYPEVTFQLEDVEGAVAQVEKILERYNASLPTEQASNTDTKPAVPDFKEVLDKMAKLLADAGIIA